MLKSNNSIASSIYLTTEYEIQTYTSAIIINKKKIIKVGMDSNY